MNRRDSCSFILFELAIEVDLGRFLGLAVCVSVHATGSTIPTYLTKQYTSSFDHKMVSTMLSHNVSVVLRLLLRGTVCIAFAYVGSGWIGL